MVLRFLKEFILLFDVSAWVTRGKDKRKVIAGSCQLMLVVITLLYLAFVLNAPLYSLTTAQCTCTDLDSVTAVRNRTTGRISVSIPTPLLIKVCSDHEGSQVCSADCLEESLVNFEGSLCDAGTLGCQCLDQQSNLFGPSSSTNTTIPEGGCYHGLSCIQDICSVNCTAAAAGDMSAVKRQFLVGGGGGARKRATAQAVVAGLPDCEVPSADALEAGNSVAVRVCRNHFLKSQQQATEDPVPPSAELERTWKLHARCVAGWNACKPPETVLLRLQVLGSSWDMVLLAAIPFIIFVNCFRKYKYAV